MEKCIISEAYLERIGVLGSLLRLRTECGRSVEMFLQHRDKAIERAGVKAYRTAVMSMDLPNIQDATEFIGCEIHPAAWRQIEIEAEGDGKIGMPTTARPGDRYVYVISTLGPNPLCKVGIANSPEKRLKQLSTASPHNLRLEFTRHSPEARAVEQAAHLHFHPHRRNGEWFAICPTDAIQFINSHIDGRPATQWQN